MHSIAHFLRKAVCFDVFFWHETRGLTVVRAQGDADASTAEGVEGVLDAARRAARPLITEDDHAKDFEYYMNCKDFLRLVGLVPPVNGGATPPPAVGCCCP